MTSDPSWNAPATDLTQTLVLYDSEKRSQCGHTVPLRRMIQRIHQRSTNCPICGTNVLYLCELSCIDNNDSARVVEFKYGKQTFRVAVPSPSFWPGWLPWIEPPTAQGRIAQVLQLDLPHMKILHKGKVLGMADAEKLSNLLMEISALHGTLLVMGTPQPPSEQWSLQKVFHWVIAGVVDYLGYLARNAVSLVLLGRPAGGQ